MRFTMPNTRGTEKDLKSLLVQANSTFEQFQSRHWPYAGTNTYELYDALGFPRIINYSDYVLQFERQDIANRIVKAPVQGTWKDKPEIQTDDGDNTAFAKDVDNIIKTLQLYKHLYKLDLLATLGRYSVLYLGLQDNLKPGQPAVRANGISYVTPIPEDRAEITQWDNNPNSPRFGLPTMYSITINTEVTSSISINVHWTRVIHVAESTLDSEVYGIPYLKPVYNRLLGLEKLSGGSPEMYWRGARPGYTAQSNENTIITDSQLDQLKDQLSSFVNNMQRWLYVEGMKISSLAPQVVSPSDHVDVQLQLISAVTRIPMRILVGSERGELASTQDERAWLNYLEERREQVAENLILRPLIEHLILLGVISAPPKGEFSIEWEPLVVLSEKEEAEIELIKMKTMELWGDTPGIQEVCPPEVLLKSLGKTDEEIEEQMKYVQKQQQERMRRENERANGTNNTTGVDKDRTPETGNGNNY
jgi:hypothetical protein